MGGNDNATTPPSGGDISTNNHHHNNNNTQTRERDKNSLHTLYNKTLIRNYNRRQQIIQTKGPINDKAEKQYDTLFLSLSNSKLVKGDILSRKRKRDEKTANSSKINMSFFGNYPGMCGSLSCQNVKLLRKIVHPYLRKKYFEEPSVKRKGAGNDDERKHHEKGNANVREGEGLKGSLAIKRSDLNYQHFCLDVDLKTFKDCQSSQLLNTEEYKFYCSERICTAERYFLSNNDAANHIFNTNYFIYEFIYTLTEHLGLKSFPIYILGKGGDFNKGFHIEIPSLIMAYHDLALLYYTCHQIMPNTSVLDPTQFYSAFGSSKYIKPNSSTLSEKTFVFDEFECTYLPYCQFIHSKEDMFRCEEPIYQTLGEAFDDFNIFKFISSHNKIYALKLFTQTLSTNGSSINEAASSDRRDDVNNNTSSKNGFSGESSSEHHSSNSKNEFISKSSSGGSNKKSNKLLLLLSSNIAGKTAIIEKLSSLMQKEMSFFSKEENDDDVNIIDDTSIPEWCNHHYHNKNENNDKKTKAEILTRLILDIFSPTLNDDDDDENRDREKEKDRQEQLLYTYNNNSDNDDDDDEILPPPSLDTNKNDHHINNNHDDRDNVITNYNNDNNKNMKGYYIGSLKIKNIVKVKLYKSVTTLDDGKEYKKVRSSKFNYDRLLESLPLPPALSLLLLKHMKWQLYINPIPSYGFGNLVQLRHSFTNTFMGSSEILSDIVYNTEIDMEQEDDEKYLFGFNDENADQNFMFLGSSLFPFSTKHVLKLLGYNNNIKENIDDDRLNNTIFYLICLYIMSSRSNTHDSYHFVLLGEWIFYLSHLRNREKFIFEFLQMYNHLHIKNKNNIFELNANYRRWVILCLKHLMIIENVIDMEEALFIMRHTNNFYDNNNDGTTKRMGMNSGDTSDNDNNDFEVLEKFCDESLVFTIPGATVDIRIPNIICASMLISNNETIFYELLSLYRPMLFLSNHHITGGRAGNSSGGSSSGNNSRKTATTTKINNNSNNLLALWDVVRWKNVQANNLKANISSYIPEIYYIANIMTHILNYRKELANKKSKKKNNVNDLQRNSNGGDNAMTIQYHQQQLQNNNNMVSTSVAAASTTNNTATTNAFSINHQPSLILLSLDEIFDDRNNVNYDDLIGHPSNINTPTTTVAAATTTTTTTTLYNTNNNSSHHCITAKNSATLLTQILNKIQAFWAGTELYSAPSAILKLLDCYILLGVCHKDGKLVDMRPLPLYYADEESAMEVGGGNDGRNLFGKFNDPFNEIEALLTHMKTCPFLRDQLYPICRNILDRNLNDQQRALAENVNFCSEQRKILDNRSSLEGIITVGDGGYPQNFEEQIFMETNLGYVAGRNINNDNIKCNIEIMSERRRLADSSRYQHHLELTEKLWNDDTLALTKLVKYFILKQMANNYTDMANVAKLCNPKKKTQMAKMMRDYVSQSPSDRKKCISKRIKLLAEILYQNLESHPYGARLPKDIAVDDMTPTTCNCPITYTLISLLQTFSYDIASLRYLLWVITRSICYGTNLKNKNLYILLGDTNSGKTFFLQCLLATIKNMAGILSSHTAHHTSTLDRYHDLGKSAASARLWYMDEIASKPLNRQLMNQITGNSQLFIRGNYESGSNVRLAPTVLIFGNNKPKFNENCPALMERLRFFTFRAQFNSNVPINFKMSYFPQLSQYHIYENVIKLGMTAILLHSTCHTGDNSPLYLYDNLLYNAIESTINIKESTDIYSPVSDIVKDIMRYCQLVEDPECIISHKRIIFLITNLQILKRINVACISDALRFLGDRYHTSLVDNKFLPIDDDHKDMSYAKTAVFHGLKENDALVNDNRVTIMQNITLRDEIKRK